MTGFVRLKTFGNYIEANIALAMLQEQGINCHIEDEATITLINLASGIPLMVYKSQAERAVKILQHAEREYLKGLRCPVCQHVGIEVKNELPVVPQKKVETSFLSQLFSFLRAIGKDISVPNSRRYFCGNCGCEFDQAPEP